MQNKLALLVSLIKINLTKNKLIAKVPFSKLNINILKILYNEGYIRGFKNNK
jgi:ribosomal protein S8